MPSRKNNWGGLFIIEVPDLDTALEWAARYPAGPNGVVEVRPCLVPEAVQAMLAEGTR